MLLVSRQYGWPGYTYPPSLCLIVMAYSTGGTRGRNVQSQNKRISKEFKSIQSRRRVAGNGGRGRRRHTKMVIR